MSGGVKMTEPVIMMARMRRNDSPPMVLANTSRNETVKMLISRFLLVLMSFVPHASQVRGVESARASPRSSGARRRARSMGLERVEEVLALFAKHGELGVGTLRRFAE